MAIKNSIEVYIDGINRTPRVVMPLKFGNFLDERLDEMHLPLRAVKQETFSPLTPVEITIKNEVYWGSGDNRVVERSSALTEYFIVANDTAEEVQVGSGLFNHDLYLIEVTKIAECCVVDTITFTNDLGRSYKENTAYADPIIE